MQPLALTFGSLSIVMPHNFCSNSISSICRGFVVRVENLLYNESNACNKSATSERAGGNKSATRPQQVRNKFTKKRFCSGVLTFVAFRPTVRLLSKQWRVSLLRLRFVGVLMWKRRGSGHDPRETHWIPALKVRRWSVGRRGCLGTTRHGAQWSGMPDSQYYTVESSLTAKSRSQHANWTELTRTSRPSYTKGVEIIGRAQIPARQRSHLLRTDWSRILQRTRSLSCKHVHFIGTVHTRAQFSNPSWVEFSSCDVNEALPAVLPAYFVPPSTGWSQPFRSIAQRQRTRLQCAAVATENAVQT